MSDRKAQIRVTQPTTPCYCTVCDAPNSIKVHLFNSIGSQPATIALCEHHADSLAQRLNGIAVRRRHLRRQSAARSPGAPHE